MNANKFFRRWQRQYQRLMQRQWVLLRQSRTRGTIEQVHELRVTLRRLRLMVRVSLPWIDRRTAQAYRSWSRRITLATSRLRDHDATLEWLRAQPDTRSLVVFLRARRQRLWRRCRGRLTPPSAELRSAIAHLESSKKGRQRLQRRYPKRFLRLESRMVADIPRFFELPLEERHAFRRTVRLLRYLRELALPKNRQAGDALLQALIRPQTALGEYQNLLLAEQILAPLRRPQTSPLLLDALHRQKTRWEREIRRSLRALARDFAPTKKTR